MVLVTAGCAASVHGGAAFVIDSTGHAGVELRASGLPGVTKGDVGESQAIWMLLGAEVGVGVDLDRPRKLRGSVAFYMVGASRHDRESGQTALLGARVRFGRELVLGPTLAVAYDRVIDATLLAGPCSDESRERYHAIRTSAAVDLAWGAHGPRGVLELGTGYAWTGYDHTHPFTECPENR